MDVPPDSPGHAEPELPARTERIRELCEHRRAHLAVDLLPILGELTPGHIFEYSTMKLVSLHKHPLLNPSHRFLKRDLDIVVSLSVVLFIVPRLCLAEWLAHRFSSPGPLFFKQSRSDANGELFQIYKFRTMHANHGQDAVQAPGLAQIRGHRGLIDGAKEIKHYVTSDLEH